MVARLVRDQEVVGSSPVASTTKKALKLKGFRAFFFYLLTTFYHLGQQIGQQTKSFLHLLSEKEQIMATIGEGFLEVFL